MGKPHQLWLNDDTQARVDTLFARAKKATPYLTVSRYLSGLIETCVAQQEAADAPPLTHLADTYCSAASDKLSARVPDAERQKWLLTELLMDLAAHDAPKSPVHVVSWPDLHRLSHTLNTYRSWLVLTQHDTSPHSKERSEALLMEMAQLTDSLCGRHQLPEEPAYQLVAEK